MSKLDSDLTMWAEDIVNTIHRTGYTKISVIERMVSDPGIATRGSKHRVLWWPRNKRIARISRAMHQVHPYGRLCVVVEYGRLVQSHNGQILTKKEFSRKKGHSCAFFDICVKEAKKKIRYLLKTYAKEAKKNKKKA